MYTWCTDRTFNTVHWCFSHLASGQTSECGPFNWLVCNSDMVVCSDLCGPDVTTDQCARCLGDSYGRHCASCHSQIVAPQLNRTSLGIYLNLLHDLGCYTIIRMITINIMSIYTVGHSMWTPIDTFLCPVQCFFKFTEWSKECMSACIETFHYCQLYASLDISSSTGRLQSMGMAEVWSQSSWVCGSMRLWRYLLSRVYQLLWINL